VRALLLLCGALLLLCCSKEPETIVRTADGQELSAEDIDRQPLALLPGGAIGLVYLQAQQLFASQFGAQLLELARKVAPLPPATGFEPRRDLERLYLGMYSMQGLDFAGVAIGTFDPAAIERAAERSDRTALGAPVVKSTYGERTLYTARNVGVVVLTSKTVLFGNETGIRRALDRINEGRVQREVPAWAEDLLDQPRAPLAAAVNLRAQPLTEAARDSFPFLLGLHTVRLLGNFEPPGINFAGTAQYADQERAQQGNQALRDYHTTLQTLGVVMSLFGIPQPVKRLETKLDGDEVQFVAGIDAQAVASLLDAAANALPSEPAPAPGAPGSPPPGGG
jgi:hypothetical protein